MITNLTMLGGRSVVSTERELLASRGSSRKELLIAGFTLAMILAEHRVALHYWNVLRRTKRAPRRKPADEYDRLLARGMNCRAK